MKRIIKATVFVCFVAAALCQAQQNVNFSSTTPAPPSFSTNCIFQTTSSNISCYIVPGSSTAYGVLKPDGTTTTATNGILTATGFTGALTGDVTGTQSTTTVGRLLGIALPTLALQTGFLFDNNGVLVLQTPTGGGNVVGSGTSASGNFAVWTNTTSTSIGPGATAYGPSSFLQVTNFLSELGLNGYVFANGGLHATASTTIPYSVLTGTPTIPTSANWPNAGSCSINQYVNSLSNGSSPSCAQVAYSQVSGTPNLPLTIAATSHLWLNSYTSGTGVFTATQPGFSDLTGALATTQGPTALTGFMRDAAGTLTAGELAGDCTTSAGFSLTCTKTSGTAFGPFATLAPVSPTAGTIIYYNGTIWTTFAGNASGTNFFSENASGVPSWSAGGGGGSGTVSSGTATQMAIYAATGTTVSGDALLTDNGTTATYSGTGGINASAGPISSTPASGVAGSASWSGNTANPSLPANQVTVIGPNAATFTAYGLQFSTTGPAAAGVFLVGAPAASISQITYGKMPLTDLATQAANTIVANVSASTAAPTAASIPSGIQNYVAGTGYSQSTGHTIIGTLTCLDSSGSGTAQTCTTSPSFTPAADDCVVYATTTANTGTGLTVNINALGVKSIAIPTGAGWSTTLAAGNVPANKPQMMCYDGTAWDLSQTGLTSTGGGGGGVTSFTGDGHIITNSASTGVVTLTIAGTSGGIPYFSSASAWQSSAALTQFGVLYGGGVGGAPASTGAGATGQILASNGGGSAPSFIDLPETHQVVPANCNNTTAGSGMSLPTSGAPTVVCRTGTNVQTGALQFGASESAQFQFELPADYDASTLPYMRINYTQSSGTASQTIAYQVQVGCSTTTDDPTFAAAQSFTTTTTGATANTPYTQTLELNSTSLTSCGGGQVMNFKIATTSGSSGPSNLQLVTVTVPRKIVVQAN